MKFLVDNQLPSAVARFIQADLGCGAQHVADVGLHDAPDSEVWRYATANLGFTHLSLRSADACLIGCGWATVAAPRF